MPKKITEEQIEESLKILEQTVPQIMDSVKGLDEIRLSTAPAPKEWSVVQNLAHLRACADIWGYSIYAMLTLDNPQMADIHPRDWDKMQKYSRLSFAENILAFEIERKNLLRILSKLSFADWGREGRFIGKGNSHTIFSQTTRLAYHEIVHWEQIEATVSAV